MLSGSLKVHALSKLAWLNARDVLIYYKPGHHYQHSFLQVRDFFDVKDDPVLGFSPPAVVTVFHTHVWDGAIDYRFVVEFFFFFHARISSFVFVW